MALSIEVETAHSITASYWRIEDIRIRPVANEGIVTLRGHKNWTQAGGPDETDRTRPDEIAKPLREFQFTLSGQDYNDHVANISDSNQLKEAYKAVQQIGTPDVGASVDFSEASKV